MIQRRARCLGGIAGGRAAAFVVAAVAALAGCGSDQRELVGYAIDPAAEVDVAEVADAANDGEPFRFVAADDGLLLVYFGFTDCPDFCPAMMFEVSRALDQLDDDAAAVSVALVTVDPERDADVLADYVAAYVADGHAIVIDDPRLLFEVADAFGAGYVVEERPAGSQPEGSQPVDGEAGDGEGDANVRVEHTTHLYAVDDTGTVLLTWVAETDADDIAGDIEQLLDERRG